MPSGRNRWAFHAGRWVWVPVLAGLAYLAFPSSAADVGPLLVPGAVADRDVVAPFDFVVNKSDAEIEQEAQALAASARPVYEFDESAFDSAKSAAQALFAALDRADGAEAIRRAATARGVVLAPAEAAYLARAAVRRRFAAALGGLLDRTLARGVMAPGALAADSAPEFSVRRAGHEVPVSRDAVITYEAYLAQAKASAPDPRSAVADSAYAKIVRRFFRPTLVADPAETARRRTSLMASVDRNKYVVRQGERIVSAHEVISGPAHEKLEGLHEELVRRGAATSTTLGGVIGPILRDALVLGVFWVLLLFYRRETYREARQVTMIGTLFAVTLLGAAAVARWRPDHPELIPLPFLAMMFTVLFNGRVSMIGAMIVAAVIGIQPVFHDQPALVFSLAGGIAAALSVRSLRRRSHLYVAVLITAGGFVAASVALGLAGSWSPAEIGLRVALGAANALVSAALTILLLPVVESLTHITTDLTLLELSDPSRPLLRRLSVEAPGTYAHSVAMANLVEAACNRIGANGLLGRVGCYYHDVGKLSAPQYFVENQARGQNPHDRLPPLESARIIRRHVTEGVALAADARLPAEITAFIPEHHGTTEITYFLDRAKQRGEPVGDGAEFRYPGPRPRSVETAVAMLADSIEAALRVLEDLTPAKITDAIRHIVRTKLTAGQLNESPITLQQLDEAQAEFMRVLSGMYHNRIDYPETGGGISAGWQGSGNA